MARVVLAPAAAADLAAIETHIAADNPRAAAALLDRFERKTQRSSAARPGIGRLRADLQPNVRSFAVGRYVIFYRASDLGIEVVRVLHGMRDIDRIFGPEK